MDVWIWSVEGLVLTYWLALGTTGFSAPPREFLLVEGHWVFFFVFFFLPPFFLSPHSHLC